MTDGSFTGRTSMTDDEFEIMRELASASKKAIESDKAILDIVRTVIKRLTALETKVDMLADLHRLAEEETK